MKKLLLATSVTLLLTACGTASVDDLISDPELRNEVAQECQELMMQGNSKTDECRNLEAAVIKMANNMVNGMLN